MALYNITQGGLVNALDPQQIINLLTGVMTDQQVTVANRIRAALSPANSGTGGYCGQSVGAPSTGTWNAGDFVTDSSNGKIWMCTTAGTPGTWKSVTFA